MHRRSARITFALATLAAISLATALIVRGGASADTAAVTIDNFSFTPATVTVAPGTTVTWTHNQNGVQHTVSADDGSFDSGRLAFGQSFQQTFSQAGTYAYHCNVHSSMHGTVVVSAGTSAPATGTPVPVAGTPGSVTRTNAAGFNLVGVPAGTALGAAAVYAYDPASNGYTAVDPGAALQGGKGYWAFFDAAGSVTLPAGSNTPVTVPATAGTWYLIGDPSGALPALVTGADAVYTYDVAGGKYVSATMLQPGDGAWAQSTRGGTITITPGGASATPTPILTPSPTTSSTPQPAATQAPTQAPAPTRMPTPYTPYTPRY